MNNNENLVQRLTDAVYEALATHYDITRSGADATTLIADAIRAHLNPHPVQDLYEHFLSYSGMSDDQMLRYAYFHGANADCEKPAHPPAPAVPDGEAVANADGLLPCPFCGDDGCSVAVMQESASGEDYSFSAEAQCMCGAAGPEAYGACASDAALSAINTWNRRAHPAPHSDDAGRVAELEAKLLLMVDAADRDTNRIAALESQLAESEVDNVRIRSTWSPPAEIAELHQQLAESRKREAKLIADLDANLEAFSDERKRALSAENLARELHELLADYVSQDSIAQGYGAGIGGTTYEKAEAFLDALAAEQEKK